MIEVLFAAIGVALGFGGKYAYDRQQTTNGQRTIDKELAQSQAASG